jgi:hypothetical protein
MSDSVVTRGDQICHSFSNCRTHFVDMSRA